MEKFRIKRNKMNLFVIRLALSYINAVELQHYLSIPPDKSVLIILYQKKNRIDVEHIKTIIDKSRWGEIHYLPYNFDAYLKYLEHEYSYSKNGVLKRFCLRKNFVAKFSEVLSRYPNCSRVIVGNTFVPSMRHIAHKAQPGEIVNVDEGFKTYTKIIEKENLRRIEKYSSALWDWCKAIAIYTISGYKIWSLKNIRYFTSYAKGSTIQNDIWLNSFECLRFKMNKKSRKKQVLFLGQSLSELSFVDEDTYIDLIQKITVYFSSYDFFYQPHRDESSEKLERLRLEAGIKKIGKATMPIELRMITDDCLPEVVGSFFSSALQNLNHIFGRQIEVVSFYLPESFFIIKDEAKLSEIEGCYKYLQKQSIQGIKIVELPSIPG